MVIIGCHDIFKDSPDEVEALLKRHRAFLSTLSTQEERVSAFNKQAEKLIAAQHCDSEL